MLMALGMAVYLAGDIGALFGCVALFSPHQPSVPVVIVGFATGYAVTRRSLPLAGAGVVEALLPFALSWVGVPLARAVAAVVVYRLFNLWLATIPGLVGLRSVRRPRRR